MVGRSMARCLKQFFRSDFACTRVRHHDRSAFACASPPLDAWLQQTAQQHQRRGLSKAFVAVLDEQRARILGYYARTACEVLTQALPDDALTLVLPLATFP